MFKKQLLASVAAVAVLIGTAEMASAADLILKARNTSANKDQLWNGWYVGGEVGWAESRFRGVHQGWGDRSEAHPGNISGFVAPGFHIGYNKRINSYVVGVEGDLFWPSHNKIRPGGNVTAGSNTFTGVGNTLDLLGSIRGRLGFVARDNLMLFATGGWAYARARHTVYGSGSPRSATVKLNGNGYVVGGGAEWALNDIASVRVQGLHYVFNKSAETASLRVGSWNAADHGILKDVLSVRAGISFNLSNLMMRR